MDKNEAPNFRHGLYESSENFSHEEKLRVWEQAESYMERLGDVEPNTIEASKCYELAMMDYRIARAENLMIHEVEEYLHKQTPESNLSMIYNRREKIQKNLGLLEESPEARKAENAGAFFDAMSNSDNEE